jgi:hypothetical protein
MEHFLLRFLLTWPCPGSLMPFSQQV